MKGEFVGREEKKMQQPDRRNRISSLIIPIVIHLGISTLVGMAISAVITGKMAPTLLNSDLDSNTMMTKFMEEVMKYTTQMATLTALLSLPIFVWMFKKDRKIEESYGANPKRKTATWRYSGIIVLGVALCVGLNNLLTLSNLALISDSYQEVSEGFYSASFLLQVVGIGIIVPITEEMLFRGVLYNRLTGMMTKKNAMLMSAVFFGVYHGNVVQAIYGGILGYILVYLYQKYGSIYAPILGHIVMNLISVTFTHYNVFQWIFDNPLRMGIITVACATISASILVWIHNGNIEDQKSAME
ncbi:lysostaphin resistance A-like protein [Lachnospiraceae bacterium LCP25S3_G4]